MRITRNDVQERFTICVPYAWLDNHIITGYRPDTAAVDLKLSNTDLELITKNLDSAKVIFGGGTPDFYKYCDRVLKGMFNAAMCDDSPEKFLLECGVVKEC